MEIAKEFGFERFEPENLSLSEQAKIFSEASVLVGPSGAAWVGLLFCEDAVRCLSWLPKEYDEFSTYSSLGALLGHNITFIESTYPSPLKHSSEAYKRGYTVCAQRFRRALGELCSETTSI